MIAENEARDFGKHASKITLTKKSLSRNLWRFFWGLIMLNRLKSRCSYVG